MKLRPPPKNVTHSFSTGFVGFLAMGQTLFAMFYPAPLPFGEVADQLEGAQVALWWIAYAAVKAARIYEYRPLTPTEQVPTTH